MWPIFKVFIEFVTILLVSCFVFFDHQACGLLAARPGTKSTPSALEGELFTTGPPGKFPSWTTS